MMQVMSASIEALFILMGYPEPHSRRNTVCMEKFLAAQCSYEQKLLRIRLNTGSLAIGLLADKKASGYVIRNDPIYFLCDTLRNIYMHGYPALSDSVLV
eukprot:8698509-Ditylum_brightwellii.AAC.1